MGVKIILPSTKKEDSISKLSWSLIINLNLVNMMLFKQFFTIYHNILSFRYSNLKIFHSVSRGSDCYLYAIVLYFLTFVAVIEGHSTDSVARASEKIQAIIAEVSDTSLWFIKIVTVWCIICC